MLRPIDNYFLEKETMIGDCLLFLRQHIIDFDTDITEEWKYKMPFYYYKGKMLCYLWTEKKTGCPYLGIVDGNKIERPELISEKRNRMKIFLIDPTKDIPVQEIDSILTEIINIRKSL